MDNRMRWITRTLLASLCWVASLGGGTAVAQEQVQLQRLGQTMFLAPFRVPASGGRAAVRGSAPGHEGWNIEGTARLVGSAIEVSWTRVRHVERRADNAALAAPLLSRFTAQGDRVGAGISVIVAGDPAALAAAISSASTLRPVEEATADALWTDMGCEPVVRIQSGQRVLQTQERPYRIGIGGRPEFQGRCRPHGPFRPLELAVEGCRPRILGDIAVETARLVDTVTGAVVEECAEREGAARSTISNDATACPVWHDWENRLSYGQEMRRTMRGQVLRACAPVATAVWQHETRACGEAELPAWAVDLADGAQALPLVETVIRPYGGEPVVVRPCQPAQEIEHGSLVLAQDICPGQYDHDMAGQMSYRTARWYVARRNADEGGWQEGERIHVLDACIRDTRTSYRHEYEFARWEHLPASRRSRMVLQVSVNLPGNSRLVLADAWNPAGMEQVWRRIGQEIVALGEPQQIGCETWQRHVRRSTWRRPDGTTAVTEDGSAPAERIGTCS